MDFIEDYTKKEHDYVTYARQFDSYRWYKPILTIIFFVLFYIIFAALLVAIAGAADFMYTGGDIDSFTARFTGGYDNMNIYDVTGVVVNMGSVAIMLPAFILARGVVRERTFTSYTSSRGGWSHTVFFKCFLIALVVCACPILIYVFLIETPGEYHNQFSKYAFYLLLVLCPLQCMAEEYIFRGLVNQTLGAWLRIPIIAIVLSAVGFAALHPYNRIGQIAILASGIGMGLSAWIGRGVEVSGALHIVNNLTAFLLDGFGFSKVQTNVTVREMVLDIGINVAYVAVIFFLSKKTDWFDRLKFDDAVEFNEDLAAKKRRKAEIKAAKQAKKEAKREEKAAKREAKSSSN